MMVESRKETACKKEKEREEKFEKSLRVARFEFID